MKFFKDQVLGETRVDFQDEKIPKHILDRIVSSCHGKRQPLNQYHDLTHNSAGYIENIRLIEDVNNTGDWSLIGDVYCDDSDLKVVLGGFSISYLDVTDKLSPSPDFLVYLPYPYYSDKSVIEAVSADSNVNVGRWVKKGADPATIAIIGATAVFILKPVWEDLYKTNCSKNIHISQKSMTSLNHERFRLT
jgi:hypothetical protein